MPKLSSFGSATCERARPSALCLPGYEEVEHSQRHEGNPDVKGNSDCSVLLEDFLQLLGLAGLPSFWLRTLWGLFTRWGRGRRTLQISLLLNENGIKQRQRKNIWKS